MKPDTRRIRWYRDEGDDNHRLEMEDKFGTFNCYCRNSIRAQEVFEMWKTGAYTTLTAPTH